MIVVLVVMLCSIVQLVVVVVSVWILWKWLLMYESDRVVEVVAAVDVNYVAAYFFRCHSTLLQLVIWMDVLYMYIFIYHLFYKLQETFTTTTLFLQGNSHRRSCLKKVRVKLRLVESREMIHLPATSNLNRILFIVVIILIFSETQNKSFEWHSSTSTCLYIGSQPTPIVVSRQFQCGTEIVATHHHKSTNITYIGRFEKK